MSGTAGFPTTVWSVVASSKSAETTQAREALAQLCSWYWRPIYAYICRKGYDTDQARDLTQAFFTALLEKNFLSSVDQSRGRFRAWLMAAVGNFLSNELDRAHALKRGGGHIVLPLEWQNGPDTVRIDPATNVTPESEFEKRWALTLLERTIERVQRESKEAHFEELKPFLTGDRLRGSYAELASRLNVSAESLRVAVHRLRKRYRNALRAEILETVSDPADVDSEIRFLLRVLSAPNST